jgi:two-component system chemotaxis response regulator CheB
MDIKKKIRVLVVDDSIVFREVLSRGISTDPNINVISTATDPFDARDKIVQYEPDVMICDIEMPKMNGIEFIRRLMPQYPLPIIVVSSISEAVFDAMNAGAVDFVVKPDVSAANSVENFILELISKIKIASVANILDYKKQTVQGKIMNNPNVDSRMIIAIGASTGGTEAISHILKALPASTPGIVIVQHIPPVFSHRFAERLNEETNLNVKEAETGDLVEKGKVLIAPGGQHMKIKKVGAQYKVQCFEGDKVNGHCPSVDVLFESVAQEAGKMAIGVILTGMGYDGAKGLLLMRRSGARTISQDEKSAVVYGMPKVAYSIGAVEIQTSLDNIAKEIYSLIG